MDFGLEESIYCRVFALQPDDAALSVDFTTKLRAHKSFFSYVLPTSVSIQTTLGDLE